jgi:hypothetical protein
VGKVSKGEKKRRNQVGGGQKKVPKKKKTEIREKKTGKGAGRK